MNQNVTSYPLSWPRGYVRTDAGNRQFAKFSKVQSQPGQSWKSTAKLTVADALGRLMDAISAFTRAGKEWRINPDNVVVSTNVRTRVDGLPISGQKEPKDPGVAVYLEKDGKPIVLCCDKWTRLADNIAAVAATLDAMRSLERWGVAESERVFTGFTALPAPGDSQARTCWEVLGIPCTRDRDQINVAYRNKTRECHPDRPGGSHDRMAELNTARDQALAQC